jgi:hypothetical protein
MASPTEPNRAALLQSLHDCPKVPDQYEDDMDDQLDLDRYEYLVKHGQPQFEPLFHAIRIVQDKIYEAYSDFDDEAVRYRKWYLWISVLAVICGATSVFFAVVEVMNLILPWDLFEAGHAEVIFTLATIALISWGLVKKYKENWILSRYKAENLRLLKFSKLTDPSMWCEPADLEAAASELQEEVEEIAAQKYEDAKAWAAKGVHPKSACVPCEDRCPEALHELVDYYVPKRLDVQIRYLEGRSERQEKRGEQTATYVLALFWGSFAFVLAHIAVGFLQQPDNTAPHHLHTLDLMALAALILPIGAAAFRTYRAANEFERNSSRHRATLDSMHYLSHQLRETKDLGEKFKLIGFCELVLEADCREFLRLVSEAEWYG